MSCEHPLLKCKYECPLSFVCTHEAVGADGSLHGSVLQMDILMGDAPLLAENVCSDTSKIVTLPSPNAVLTGPSTSPDCCTPWHSQTPAISHESASFTSNCRITHRHTYRTVVVLMHPPHPTPHADAVHFISALFYYLFFCFFTITITIISASSL